MVDSKSSSRKKATLTPKLYQAHISNVKESFYLFDHTKCLDQNVRNTLINNQIETLLLSKLYGTVILLSFRNFSQHLKFESEELNLKFSKVVLQANTIKVEIEGPPIVIPGVDAKMPGKRERFTVCHLDNLVLVNLCPSLSGTRSDPTSCY